MKIDIRMEDGSPVIFWTDNPDMRNGIIMSYAKIGQHSEACRAYMRSLKKPTTKEEIDAAFNLLYEWSRL